jgi:hypothetical protein
MEFCPVVEVVEIDGFARSLLVVWEACCTEDCASRRIVMIVRADRSVELFDDARPPS